MGTYLTPAHLLARGAATAAELASPTEGPVLSADLLRQAVAQTDLSGYDAVTQAALFEALAWIDTAIARAESDLHGAARGRYALPLAPVDDLVTGLLLDLAWAYLHRYQRPEAVAKAADLARADLARIADGRIVLAAAPAAAAAPSSGSDAPSFVAGESVFDADALSDFGGRW